MLSFLQLSQYAIVKELSPDIADDGSVIIIIMTDRPSSMMSGGGERDRTDDLLVANQALSQLSYTHDSHLPNQNLLSPIEWWA